MIQKIGNWLRMLLNRKPTPQPYPSPMPNPPDLGVYISNTEARALIIAQLGDKITSFGRQHLHFADTEYYCPALDYVKKVLAVTRVDGIQYRAQVLDCEDFAKLLMAKFVEDAYRAVKDANGVPTNKVIRRAAHCFGLIHGNLPGPHAQNFVITDDKILRIVEPQTDDIFLPGDTIKSVWLMLA